VRATTISGICGQVTEACKGAIANYHSSSVQIHRSYFVRLRIDHLRELFCGVRVCSICRLALQFMMLCIAPNLVKYFKQRFKLVAATSTQPNRSNSEFREHGSLTPQSEQLCTLHELSLIDLQATRESKALSPTTYSALLILYVTIHGSPLPP
jgi:hypothetical protein